MASDKKEAVEYSPVEKDNFFKASVKREGELRDYKWPKESGFYVDEYKKLNSDLDKGRENLQLPHHRCPVEDVFEPFQPESQNIRPLPPTSAEMYGWKYGNSQVHTTYKWTPRYASPFFHHQVGWPEDNQW